MTISAIQIGVSVRLVESNPLLFEALLLSMPTRSQYLGVTHEKIRHRW